MTATQATTLFYLSDYPNLAAADQASAAGGLLLINCNTTLTANTTVKSSIVGRGGVIVCAGFTLTLAKNPSAPDYTSLFNVTAPGSAVVLPKGCTSELRWFSPAADGRTNDTIPCRAWAASSKVRHALPGRYVTDTFYFAFKGDPGGTGYSVEGDGQQTTFISLSGNSIMTLDPGLNASINVVMPRIGNFRCENPGGYSSGKSAAINLALPISAGTGGFSGAEVYDINAVGFARGVWFDGDYASKLWYTEAWFSTTFNNVNAYKSGGHCIESLGPMNTFINCNGFSYGLSGPPSGQFAVLRLHGGHPTIIGMNCVYQTGQWGAICGDYNGPFNGSVDGVNCLCFPTFIGCNFEICTAGGIMMRFGQCNVINCTFTPKDATCKAIYSNSIPSPSYQQPSTLCAQFGGLPWMNGSPVHLTDPVSPWSVIQVDGATGVDIANYKLTAYVDRTATPVVLPITNIVLPGAFAALPKAPYTGFRAMITDSQVTWTVGIGTIVAAGGGTNTVSVTFNGTNYVIG